MPTLTQLEYLLAVDQHRHFGRAAKASHISQPTLSMQIQKVEDEFGFIFFDRTKQPVVPTPQARGVLEQARHVVSEMKKFESLIRNRVDQPEGVFRLGVIPTVAPFLLPRFLVGFALEHPKIQLQISEIPTDSILDGLERETLDAGILATPLQIPSLSEKPLFYEPFQVYHSEGHPLGLKKKIVEGQIDSKDIWLLAEGHCFRNQILELCSRRKPGSGALPNVELEGGSLETVMSLVDQGRGFTLIPELLVLGLSVEKKLRCKKFMDPVPSREISLISRRTQFKGTLLNLLESAITRSLPESLPRSPSKKISVIPVVS